MKRNLDALDALKGVAALAIAFYAWSGFTIWAGSAFVGQFYLFIDFFFVFTGFLLAEVYRDSLATKGDLGRFAVLRLARLYPIHLFFILPLAGIELMKLIYSAFGAEQIGAPAFGAEHLSLAGLAANLTLTQAFGWVATPGWNEPSWYVAIEFWVSLVFAGLCLIGVMRSAIGRSVLGLAVIASLIWMVATTADLGEAHPLIRGVYAFGVGVAAHSVLCMPRLDRMIAAFRGRFGGLLEIVALGLVCLYLSGSQGGSSFAAPIVFAARIFVFADGRGAISNMLRGGVFRVVGKFSYSIYMSHFLFIMPMRNIVEAASGDSAVVVASYFVGVYLSLTLIFGIITERLVEQPTRSAVRQWLNGRSWAQKPKRPRGSKLS